MRRCIIAAGATALVVSLMPIPWAVPAVGAERGLTELARADVVASEVVVSTVSGSAHGASDPPAGDLSDRGWRWPTAPVRVARAFVAPAHEYGAGHRGIDLVAAPGAELRAPAAGVVAFSGAVAGRPVLTIDHGDGLVTTLEAVLSDLPAGVPVAAGDVVATVASGGHAEPGTVHFGVRFFGDYINPMLLLGGIPRAVLLPCC